MSVVSDVVLAPKINWPCLQSPVRLKIRSQRGESTLSLDPETRQGEFCDNGTGVHAAFGIDGTYKETTPARRPYLADYKQSRMECNLHLLILRNSGALCESI